MASRPFRVCFPFVGDSIGGSHFSALTLVDALDRAAVEPVIVLHQEGPLADHLRTEGLDFEMLPLKRSVGRDSRWSGHLTALAATCPALIGFLRRRSIDIVHSNDARMHMTWALPARLAGSQQLWHERNVFAPSRLAQLMLRLPRRCAAISRFVSTSLPTAGRAKASVIPNPFEPPSDLDREVCRTALLEELSLPPETLLIGWFGNLIAWKRPLVFVEAAARIAERLQRPCAFPVFGEDREGLRAEMEALAAEKGIGERVRFMGFRAPVWPWLAGCDLMLAPAINEPFGRTLVEAMLVGTPVVATDSGGHREIARDGETTLLVPLDDPDALADAAVRLLNDTDLRTDLVQRAHKDAPARFGARAHAARMTGLYREMLGDRNPDAVALVIADMAAGGAQRVVANLANAWTERGRPVTLVTLDDGDSAFPLDPRIEHRSLGLQKDSAGLLQALMSTWQRVRALRRALRSCAAGSAIGFVGATNVLLVLAAFGLPIRVVISERNDPARQSLGQPWDFLRRLTYRWADAVTANSAGAVDTLAAWVPRHKLRLILNPLVPDAGAPEGFAAPTLLAIGRLHRQKGFDLLLDAFAASAFLCQGGRLMIVGRGPQGDALAAQARSLGIGDSVDWRARSENPFPLYAGAQALVLPSRFEGTPNVLLEALASGCPAIVTDTAGAAPDLIGRAEEAGLIVPGEDKEALAAAIDRLTGDETLRANLSAAGPARVEEFSLDRVLPAWEALLEGGAIPDASPGESVSPASPR